MSETHHYTCYACDICGKQSDAVPTRYDWGESLPGSWRKFTIRHPNKDSQLFSGRYWTADCCSEECLQAAVQKYLDASAA